MHLTKYKKDVWDCFPRLRHLNYVNFFNNQYLKFSTKGYFLNHKQTGHESVKEGYFEGYIYAVTLTGDFQHDFRSYRLQIPKVGLTHIFSSLTLFVVRNLDLKQGQGRPTTHILTIPQPFYP